jgi:hypothetical protein
VQVLFQYIPGTSQLWRSLAEKLLELWRGAEHVSELALPDLGGVSVLCKSGERRGYSAAAGPSSGRMTDL